MHEQQDMLCKEGLACAGSTHLGHVGEEGAVGGQLGEEAREVGAHDQDALHILLAQEARLRSITGSVSSLAPAPAVLGLAHPGADTSRYMLTTDAMEN